MQNETLDTKLRAYGAVILSVGILLIGICAFLLTLFRGTDTVMTLCILVGMGIVLVGVCAHFVGEIMCTVAKHFYVKR